MGLHPPARDVSWDDGAGPVELPGGARVRGRRLGAPASPADSAVVLGRGPLPPWPARRVRRPDSWVPLDRADAIAALTEAWGRARAGGAGRGRRPRRRGPLRVRERYAPRAVETPWRRRWLRSLGPSYDGR